MIDDYAFVDFVKKYGYMISAGLVILGVMTTFFHIAGLMLISLGLVLGMFAGDTKNSKK
jgi:uncharacterized membrane protein